MRGSDLPLPYNMVVREESDASITVAFMDPEAVLKVADTADVPALGKEEKTVLQRVCASLKA